MLLGNGTRSSTVSALVDALVEKGMLGGNEVDLYDHIRAVSYPKQRP
jgi:hypothetical protein